MKAVLDTNVLISSVISTGVPHEIVVKGFVASLRAGEFTLPQSAGIVYLPVGVATLLVSCWLGISNSGLLAAVGVGLVPILELMTSAVLFAALQLNDSDIPGWFYALGFLAGGLLIAVIGFVLGTGIRIFSAV